MSKYPHQQPFNKELAALSGERVSSTLAAWRKDYDAMTKHQGMRRPGSNKHR